MRTAELLIRPQDPRQLGSLAKLIATRGLEAQIDEDGVSVVVADGSPWAGELNRAALEAGITIVHLAERERNLEDAYFALTGTHSGDVEVNGALGGIQ
jgi:hypothetical protein